MKILAMNASPAVNGSFLAGCDLWESLCARSHEVVVAAPPSSPALEHARRHGFRTLPQAVPVWWSGFEGRRRYTRHDRLVRASWRYARGRAELRRSIEECAPDLAYVNSSATILGALAARTAVVSLVTHVRERIDTTSGLGRAHARVVAAVSDRIVASSACAAQPISASGAADRIRVIHDGVRFPERDVVQPISWRATSDLPRDAFVVGVVGSYSEIKGQWIVPDVAARVAEEIPHVVFVFFGMDGRVESFFGRVRAALLGNHRMPSRATSAGGAVLHFAGWTDDVVGSLRAVDAVLFPSVVHEGFGRPLVEAGFASRPVVAFGIGAAPEIVRSEETGMLVDEGDLCAMAAALVALARDPARARAMGERGRGHVSAVFGHERHVEGLIALLEETHERASAARSATPGLSSLWGLS